MEFPLRVRYFFDGHYQNLLPLDQEEMPDYAAVDEIPDGDYWLLPASVVRP